VLPGADFEIAVAEVSSFQLAAIRTFRPRVGLLLNCSEDHLDWHADLAEYEAAKARLFENMNESDAAVLNADDPLCQRLQQKLASPVYLFARRPLPGHGAFPRSGGFVVQLPHRQDEYRLDNPGLAGGHNLENAMAAALGAALAGAEPAAIQEALDTFLSLPHRVQRVAEIGGVLYIDDSKGTNPDACARAIEAAGRPVVLIAGGKEKNLDYRPVAAALKRHGARAAVCMGECGTRLFDLFRGELPARLCRTMEEAVAAAAALAKPGDAVLLSSGTSSFDAYKSYAERGDHFQRCVRQLEKERG
jgi:UDP-N-acetylmuramoylalanine--D-glutamate ligase